MTTPEPTRPASVPADARWQPDKVGFEWTAGPVDDAGAKHGTYRSWTAAGGLHGEATYVHGALHGDNKNFHPDGSLASVGEWRDGALHDCVYYKATGESPEPWPGDAGPTVTSVRYCSRDGVTNYTIKFFAGDTEVAATGAALPERPAAVTADARWFPDLGRWVDGAIARGTNAQVGDWKWWDGAGALVHAETRDAAGKPLVVVDYEDGVVSRKKTTTADGGEDDEWFRGGAPSAVYKKDGQGRRYYEAHWYAKTGELREETAKTFDATGLAAVTEKGARGVLLFAARREGDAMDCRLYADDGTTPAATGLIRGDRLAGVWRIFDGAGAVRREIDTTPYAIKRKPTHQGLAFGLGDALYQHDEPAFATPDQLAGVDAITWAKIAGCYSDDVDKFPRLLRGMVSGDPLVAQYSAGCIDSEIEHQGSTYPATAAVIPWLAKLLTHPNADRARLLGLIKVAGQCAKPYLREVADLPADDDNRIAIEGTYHAVGAAWPAVWAQYPSADPMLRRVILAIATCAPPAKDDLLALATKDADPAIRACAVDSLTSLDATAADAVLDDVDPLVRAAAAIAIGSRRGPDAPAAVVRVLAVAIETAKQLQPRFAQLPYTDGHILAYVAIAAGSVRTPAARELAPALCARIDDVDGVSAPTYARGLCALGLGRGERPFAPAIVDIVATLATSKQLWVFNVNAAEVLRDWNLPADPKRLAALVETLRASADPEATLHAAIHS